MTFPLLSQIPWLGPIFFTNQKLLVYIGYLFFPLAWYFINYTRPGMHLRAVGEYPAAADTLGINVFALRYFYVFVGGMLAGLAGATISLAVSPGWFSELTTAGQGWIAVGLVIFAQWDPLRAAVGAYTFGALRRLVLDIQGPLLLFGLAQPFLLQPLSGVLPADAAVRLYHHRAGDWFARGHSQAPGRADCAGPAVYPWRARFVVGMVQNFVRQTFAGYSCSLCGAVLRPAGSAVCLPERRREPGCDSGYRRHPPASTSVDRPHCRAKNFRCGATCRCCR